MTDDKDHTHTQKTNKKTGGNFWHKKISPLLDILSSFDKDTCNSPLKYRRMFVYKPFGIIFKIEKS